MIIMSEKEEFPPQPEDAHYFLDITEEVCPFTFVHTKLLVERLKPGEIAEIRLNAGEPLDNVPRSVAEQGDRVIGIRPEDASRPQGVHRLWIRKG
jgi:TusA-related sulfurtransferase